MNNNITKSIISINIIFNKVESVVIIVNDVNDRINSLHLQSLIFIFVKMFVKFMLPNFLNSLVLKYFSYSFMLDIY